MCNTSKKYNCPNCGAPIEHSAVCPYCGTRLEWIPTISTVEVKISKARIKPVRSKLSVPMYLTRECKEINERWIRDALLSAMKEDLISSMTVEEHINIESLDKVFVGELMISEWK